MQKNPCGLKYEHIALHGFPTKIESLRRYTPNNLFRNITTVMIEYPITAIKVRPCFIEIYSGVTSSLRKIQSLRNIDDQEELCM